VPRWEAELKNAILFAVATALATIASAAEQGGPSGRAVSTDGAVTIGKQRVDYRATAGAIVVHPVKAGGETSGSETEGTSDGAPPAGASIFYVAYIKRGVTSPDRPITFVYNGGPGSSTMWLHMAGFGPKRVLTKDGIHTPAPYRLVDNSFSLLDVSDLVFIDAPGVGFSTVWGKDKEKAFYGLDADANAFAEFVSAYLTRSHRWNSPKFLFGESYGTTRSAILANRLQSRYNIDLTGLIQLSQILNFDLGSKGPQYNPGVDQAYIVSLPTYAAVAWYYDRLPAPKPQNLEEFLHRVEQYASTEYTVALQAGSTLDPARREAVAKQISAFTGLPVDYVLKSDLRIDSGQFRKVLLGEKGLTLGMCDARFAGPTVDPLSKEADNSILPDLTATLAAFVSATNDYVRDTLGYGGDQPYQPMVDADQVWVYDRDQPANAPTRIFGVANVTPDLAAAMKSNPDLKVMVNGGYYDFCTCYYAGWYEMHHLPIPATLRGNIEYHYYRSGHWPYLVAESMAQLHDNIADFIRRAARY